MSHPRALLVPTGVLGHVCSEPLVLRGQIVDLSDHLTLIAFKIVSPVVLSITTPGSLHG